MHEGEREDGKHLYVVRGETFGAGDGGGDFREGAAALADYFEAGLDGCWVGDGVVDAGEGFALEGADDGGDEGGGFVGVVEDLRRAEFLAVPVVMLARCRKDLVARGLGELDRAAAYA